MDPPSPSSPQTPFSISVPASPCRRGLCTPGTTGCVAGIAAVIAVPQAGHAVLGVLGDVGTEWDLGPAPVVGCGVPGGADRLKAVSFSVGPMADKDAEHGFGPSLGRGAASAQEIITGLISIGQACPPLPGVGIIHPSAAGAELVLVEHEQPFRRTWTLGQSLSPTGTISVCSVFMLLEAGSC